MSEIAEIFSRNILEEPHTEEELDQIIDYMRRRCIEQAQRKAKGLAPRKPAKIAQVEARERKAKLKAKGIDPRQLSLLDQIAAARPDDDQKGA
jgi:hypothetical protein